jgi:hypothetical protein
VETGRLDEAEEVLDVVFPSGDEAAEVVHPGKESLHLPAFSIAAELAAILCSASPRRQIGAAFVGITSSRSIVPSTSWLTEDLAWIVERANLSQ